MNLQTLIANYAKFNLWANEGLMLWMKSKPEADLAREAASSYPSLLKTLNHIWESERFWYRVVTKAEKPYDPSEPPASMDAEALFARAATQSAQLAEYVVGLNEGDMQELITFDSPWVKGTLSRYEFLQHVFNHGTYHRGQLVSIGRQLGYTDAPMTDYNFYNMVVLKRGT